MSLFNSKFQTITGGRLKFVFLGIFVMLIGVCPVVSMPDAVDEKRRIARLKATYLIHLIKFSKWSPEDLPKNDQAPKILILGDDGNGLVDAFKFLASQSTLKIQNNKVDIMHFENDQKKEAIEKFIEKPQLVYILSDSVYKFNELKNLSPKSLFIGNGREMVVKSGGDISFLYSKNRVRLIVSKRVFTRISQVELTFINS